MPVHQRKAAVAAVTHNHLVAKLGRVWKTIAALTDPDAPNKSGWISVCLVKTENGTFPTIFLKGRRDVHPSWHVPTLMLDATFQPELIRLLWPTLEMKADVRLSAPHQHITQVIDRSYSKSQLGIRRKPAPTDEDPEIKKGLRDVHAILCRYARQYAPGRVLAICQLDAEKRLPQIGPLPANLEVAHHNALAGKDIWADVAALVIVGRTAASPEDVEDAAETLTGEAIERIPGWYPKADAAREMTDGSFRPAETDRHPNPVAEAIRWGIVEAQLLQAVGRGRGCNRKADNPIDILIMTNAPIPLPIQQMISDADLKPSIHDLQMAAGGIAFEKPSGAAAAYPQLWETLNAAEVAFRRAKQDQKESNPNNELIIRERLLLVATATYRKAGERFSPGTAYVDLNIVPDPKAWLTERIGTLAHFSMSVPQAPSEPVRQPSASAEPEPVAPPHAEPAPPQHRQRR